MYFRLATSISRIGLFQTVAMSHTGRKHVHNGKFKAVIFDMGGVLIRSPGKVFEAYEKQLGLERGLIVSTIVRSGGDGAWCRMERGEFPATELGRHLSDDIKSLVRTVIYFEIRYLELMYFYTKETHFSAK